MTTSRRIREIVGALADAVEPTEPKGFQASKYRPTVDGRCPKCKHKGRFFSDDSDRYSCRKCGAIIGSVDMIVGRVTRH